MKMNNTIRQTALAATCVACAVTAPAATADSFSLEAFVLSDDKLVSESTVSLWISRPEKRPELVSSTTSDKNGTARFKDIDQVNGDVFYLRSSGGKIKGTPVPQYETLAVLNGDQRATATLNEISTIGSLWPIAGMFDYQTGLAGTANGLLIGSSQVSNLVNVEQGFFGAVVLNGTNLTKSETVARINTLAALTALCGAELARQHCSDYLAITGSNSTLEALVKLATQP